MSITFVQGIKSPVSIKNMIHKRLAGWEKPRSYGTLHASDLMRELEFCPREQALISLGAAKKRDNFVGTSLRITFAHGRDMEKRLRNEWLRDVMVGYWKCGVCGHIHPTFGKVPKINCPKCGWGHQWTYEEVRFHSPISGVSGGIDGLVDVGRDKLRILEIKSIDKDAFKKLVAPMAEHKFRTSLYLQLAEESNLGGSNRVDTTIAHLLYVSKSFGFADPSLKEAGISDSPFSPFKEFLIPRDDSLISTLVSRARVYTVWKTQGATGLPCGVCSNGLTQRAQKCSAVSSCFSGKYPSLFTWLENGVIKHPGKTLVD